MAQRKVTPQSAIDRLKSSARPASERDAAAVDQDEAPDRQGVDLPVVPQSVPPLVTPIVTGHVPSQPAEHVTHHETAEQAQQAEGQLTERVRGRWTPEQKAFITRYAKGQRARAAEVLRYIVAWFLAEGAPEHMVARRTLAPSPAGLVKRETGLELLDFMTTKDQAKAIDEAAGDGGQAAFLRTAVDAFRTRGPGAGASIAR